MKPKIGDVVEVDKRVIILTGFIKNTDGNPIVMWSSKKDIGGCMPSLWEEWTKGFSSRRRRGQISQYEYYKFR